jgi:hypothetical protein
MHLYKGDKMELLRLTPVLQRIPDMATLPPKEREELTAYFKELFRVIDSIAKEVELLKRK